MRSTLTRKIRSSTALFANLSIISSDRESALQVSRISEARAFIFSASFYLQTNSSRPRNNSSRLRCNSAIRFSASNSRTLCRRTSSCFCRSYSSFCLCICNTLAKIKHDSIRSWTTTIRACCSMNRKVTITIAARHEIICTVAAIERHEHARSAHPIAEAMLDATEDNHENPSGGNSSAKQFADLEVFFQQAVAATVEQYLWEREQREKASKANARDESQ